MVFREVEDLLIEENGIWKCKVCRKTSLSRSKLRDHAETHVEGLTYQCHKCYEICRNKYGLKNHIWSKHTKRDKSTGPLVQPPSNAGELVSEMVDADEVSLEDKSENVTVKLCGQAIEVDLIPSDLNREISEKINDLIEKKSHNEWKCRKCWRSSTRKCQLVNHLETHLNYTHHCPQCDFTARTRRGLKDHYKVTHKK